MTQIHTTREITTEDLPLLSAPKASRPEPVKKVSQRHHALARCLAVGMKNTEASLATGYDTHRISALKRDPLFQDLVAFYAEKVDESFDKTLSHLNGITMEAASVIRERLEERPDEIEIKDLVKLVQLGADRTGHGPTSTQNVNTTVNLADRMRAAQARLKPAVENGREVYKVEE